MPTLKFWFDYASTYSYFSAMHIEKRCLDANVELKWQPILLGPIFKNHGWETTPFKVYPVKGRYMRRDVERLAEKLALPALKFPAVFPQHTVLAARVGILAQETPWMGAYSKAVFREQYEHGRDVGGPEHIGNILDAIGQPGSELVVQASNDQSVKDALRAATEKASESGVFGAPTFTLDDGEMFWGHERLDDAIAWATSNSS